MGERDNLIAVNLSILHWDNGCRKCPLIEECKKADNDKDKECQNIWHDWLKNIVDK